MGDLLYVDDNRNYCRKDLAKGLSAAQLNILVLEAEKCR